MRTGSTPNPTDVVNGLHASRGPHRSFAAKEAWRLKNVGAVVVEIDGREIEAFLFPSAMGRKPVI